MQSLLKKLSPIIPYLLNFLLTSKLDDMTYILHITICKLCNVSALLKDKPVGTNIQNEESMCCSELAHTHLRCCLLKAVGVQGRHDVDPRVMDQLDDRLVALLVFIAQVLGQENEQFPSDSLITMHIPNVFKFRLT